MPLWNTDTIIADLTHIVGVERIERESPTGDTETDNLGLLLAGTNEQFLFVCGFDPDVDIRNTSNEIVEMVELTDGLSDKGGLTSHDFRVARAFIDVRQYFINRGFIVVGSLDEYDE